MKTREILEQELNKKTDKTYPVFMEHLNIHPSETPKVRELVFALFSHEGLNAFKSLHDLTIEIGDRFEFMSPDEFRMYLADMAMRTKQFMMELQPEKQT
jgi:hypothetical protein